MDPILILEQLGEKVIEEAKNVCRLLALDKVNREALWKILRIHNVGG